MASTPLSMLTRNGLLRNKEKGTGKRNRKEEQDLRLRPPNSSIDEEGGTGILEGGKGALKSQ